MPLFCGNGSRIIPIYSVYSDELIWIREYNCDGNSHLWHQKYSLPCIKVVGFVAYIVTSKFVRVGYAERSWGDVNKIKSGKISHLSSNISKKNIIVYTEACIEASIIVITIYISNSNYSSCIHSWNDEYGGFCHQLYKWGVGKFSIILQKK